MKKSTSFKGEINLFALLTIIFIVLKLTGNITWSWLWVFCLIWIPTVVGISIALIGALLSSLKYLIAKIKK